MTTATVNPALDAAQKFLGPILTLGALGATAGSLVAENRVRGARIGFGLGVLPIVLIAVVAATRPDRRVV